MIYAIFDTETTGLILPHAPIEKQPRCIEFAGVFLDTDTWGITKEFNKLYNPEVNLSKKITQITGLKDEDLVDMGPFVPQEIIDFFLGADRSAAHNFTFDYDILGLEFQRAGVLLSQIGALQNPLCTVEATEYLTGVRLKLGELYQYLFQEKFKGAHRAMFDVKALAKCIEELTKRGLL